MWKHALLEVYSQDDADEWPEGTPADWIEKGLVGYCNGLARDYVRFIPLRRVLWWALVDIPARVRWWMWQPVRRSDGST